MTTLTYLDAVTGGIAAIAVAATGGAAVAAKASLSGLSRRFKKDGAGAGDEFDLEDDAEAGAGDDPGDGSPDEQP